MKNFILQNPGALLGFIFLFFYITVATNLIDYPMGLAIFMFLMLGPFAIFGMVAISHFLNRERKYLIIELGKIFGISAFTIWVCIMCIQQGSRIYFSENLYVNSSPENLEIYKMIMQGVNSVQFTMDTLVRL